MQHDKDDDQQDRGDHEAFHPAWHPLFGHAEPYRDIVSLSNTRCLAYTRTVPKIWTDTIEEHRREVSDAILDATGALVLQHGLAAITMSQIADKAGIGRATLYKYFADLEAVLHAWHERHVAVHLSELAAVRDREGDPVDRLEAVLERFALIAHERHDTELATLLHRGEHVVRAQEHLTRLVRDLIAEGAKAGALREDVSANELATYCLHALTAASSLSSKPAVRRLVEVTLAGLRRQRTR